VSKNQKNVLFLTQPQQTLLKLNPTYYYLKVNFNFFNLKKDRNCEDTYPRACRGVGSDRGYKNALRGGY
jgi:hypothetical protein